MIEDYLIGACLAYWFFIAQLDLMFFLYRAIQFRLSRYPDNWEFNDLAPDDKFYLICFACVDWWVNMTSMTIRFFELPGSPFEIMTTRLQKWRKAYYGKRPSELNIIQWHRRVFADEVCIVLDDYSPHGAHC